MKPYAPLAGLLLVAMLAFGAGCAEDDSLFIGGGSGKKNSSPSGNATPGGSLTPSPSGSGMNGGIKDD